MYAQNEEQCNSGMFEIVSRSVTGVYRINGVLFVVVFRCKRLFQSL